MNDLEKNLCAAEAKYNALLDVLRDTDVADTTGMELISAGRDAGDIVAAIIAQRSEDGHNSDNLVAPNIATMTLLIGAACRARAWVAKAKAQLDAGRFDI